jgi:hypothetical protein
MCWLRGIRCVHVIEIIRSLCADTRELGRAKKLELIQTHMTQKPMLRVEVIGSIRTPLFSIQAHVTQNLVLRAEVASRVCVFDLRKQDIGMAQVCRFDGTGIKTAVPQPANSSKYKPNWQ